MFFIQIQKIISLYLLCSIELGVFFLEFALEPFILGAVTCFEIMALISTLDFIMRKILPIFVPVLYCWILHRQSRT